MGTRDPKEFSPNVDCTDYGAVEEICAWLNKRNHTTYNYPSEVKPPPPMIIIP